MSKHMVTVRGVDEFFSTSTPESIPDDQLVIYQSDRVRLAADKESVTAQPFSIFIELNSRDDCITLVGILKNILLNIKSSEEMETIKRAMTEVRDLGLIWRARTSQVYELRMTNPGIKINLLKSLVQNKVLFHTEGVTAQHLSVYEISESDNDRLIFPILGGINNESAKEIFDVLRANTDKHVYLDIYCGEDDENSYAACMALLSELSILKSKIDIKLSGTIVPLPIALLTAAKINGRVTATPHTLFSMYAGFEPQYLSDEDIKTAEANRDKIIATIVDYMSLGRDREKIEALLSRRELCTAEDLLDAELIDAIV